mmetsp:Transcript_25793/g.48540  ORF Transcript_25793/g.48540 Transcript_25793/m.48540 type:complete len:555 (-) Transcript_25793:91-1755(-)
MLLRLLLREALQELEPLKLPMERRPRPEHLGVIVRVVLAELHAVTTLLQFLLFAVAVFVSVSGPLHPVGDEAGVPLYRLTPSLDDQQAAEVLALQHDPAQIVLLGRQIDLGPVEPMRHVQDEEGGDAQALAGVLEALLCLLLVLLLLRELPGLVVGHVLVLPRLDLLLHDRLHLGRVHHGAVPHDLHEVRERQLLLGGVDEAEGLLVPQVLEFLGAVQPALPLALLLRQVDGRLRGGLVAPVQRLNRYGVLHELVRLGLCVVERLENLGHVKLDLGLRRLRCGVAFGVHDPGAPRLLGPRNLVQSLLRAQVVIPPLHGKRNFSANVAPRRKLAAPSPKYVRLHHRGRRRGGDVLGDLFPTAPVARLQHLCALGLDDCGLLHDLPLLEEIELLVRALVSLGGLQGAVPAAAAELFLLVQVGEVGIGALLGLLGAGGLRGALLVRGQGGGYSCGPSSVVQVQLKDLSLLRRGRGRLGLGGCQLLLLRRGQPRRDARLLSSNRSGPVLGGGAPLNFHLLGGRSRGLLRLAAVSPPRALLSRGARIRFCFVCGSVAGI